MRIIKLFLTATFGLLAVSTAQPAYAQTTTTGAITGVVRDKANGSGLGDVTVVATSPALQGSSSELTDSSGQYLITNLPPGVYEVVFYYGEIKVRQANVTVAVGKVTPVTIRLDTTATGGEVINITQKAPTIDVGSTKQGITIGQEYTKNIPLAGRTFEGTLGAAAGAQGDTYGVSFSGSTSVENNYTIDGINTTGLTYGTVGSPLINNFIQETEIITGGYNAEFGRSTGGVVNVVTKSGGNEFHGSVFANVQPFQGEGDPVFIAGSSISRADTMDYEADFGFDVGGPIVKDRVWFYVGFAPLIESTTVTRKVGMRVDRKINNHNYANGDGDGDPTTTTASGCERTSTCEEDGIPDLDSNGFQVFEEVDRYDIKDETTQYAFAAKVNFAVTPDHQGQVSLTGAPTSTSGPLTASTAAITGMPSASVVDTEGLSMDLSAKWNSKFMNNKTEVDVVLGWHRGSSKQTGRGFGNTEPVSTVNSTDLGTVGRNRQRESDDVLNFCTDDDPLIADPFPSRNCDPKTGECEHVGIQNCPVAAFRMDGAGLLDDYTENRYSIKVTGTQRVKAAGHHQFKAGLDLENNFLDDFGSFTGGVAYAAFEDWEATRYVIVGQGSDTCFDGETPVNCDFLETFARESSTLNWAAFLQDSWQILPNLTLNAGLRYEEQRLRATKQIEDFVDPLTGSRIGRNALTLDNLWAPRVGVLYDWTKEGRSKVYANWGRFYESIPMDINNRAFGGETQGEHYFDWEAQCGMIADTGDNSPRLPSLASGCPQNPTATEGAPAFGGSLIGAGDPALFLPAGKALIMPGLKPQYLDETVLGVEYELFEDLRVGVSYQNRAMGDVIEDLSTDGAHTYVIANPGADVDVGDLEDQRDRFMNPTDGSAPDPAKAAAVQARIDMFKKVKNFDKPRRDYNAFQLSANKRLSQNFFVQASYTYSRLEGNYPGLFSDNSGQLDPNITSQYDLIELLANRDGRLPADRPHNIKVDGFYNFDLKQAGVITTGVRLRANSGAPIETLGRHWAYGRRESFVMPRGSFGRTDFVTQADLRLQYTRPLNQNLKLTFYFDLYNIFDTQTESRVDQEYTLDRVNPIIGGSKEDLLYLKRQSTQGGEFATAGANVADLARKNINYGNTSQRFAPITSRFGVMLEF